MFLQGPAHHPVSEAEEVIEAGDLACADHTWERKKKRNS